MEGWMSKDVRKFHTYTDIGSHTHDIFVRTK